MAGGLRPRSDLVRTVWFLTVDPVALERVGLRVLALIAINKGLAIPRGKILLVRGRNESRF